MTIRLQSLAIGSILLLSSLAAGCRATPAAPSTATAVPVAARNADGYFDITAGQLAAMLPAKNFTFVNVHVPYQGEIAQTDAFIPYDQIADHLGELPAKDAPIVLYCRSGRMSTEVAATLARLGYTNVMELDGGFNEWKAEGHELLVKQ